MLDVLERQQKLTTNQWKIISAAILGDMLDFFDYGLIAFALAFIVGHWKLTYGQSAMILLAAGIGAVPGALVWGWLADRIGRRTVFIGTALNFSIFTGIMALTPDAGGWIFLAVCRLFVGAGVSGLFAVDLPLVQEFVPSSKRGWVGGIVTCCLPLGGTLAALLGAYLEPYVGWRGLFAIGLLPAFLTLLIRAWGIAEMANAHGATRRGPQIACLGLADRCERHRAAQCHF
jgi:putative MFS transporter